MTLLEEFLALLDQLALDVGPRFSTKLPASPDRAVAVARYAGPESALADNYDSVNLQLRTRGPAVDTRIAERDADLLYDALNGLAGITLAGGTWLSQLVGVQAGPVYIGQDSQGRDEYTINFRAEVSRTSANRENP